MRQGRGIFRRTAPENAPANGEQPGLQDRDGADRDGRLLPGLPVPASAGIRREGARWTDRVMAERPAAGLLGLAPSGQRSPLALHTMPVNSRRQSRNSLRLRDN